MMTRGKTRAEGPLVTSGGETSQSLENPLIDENSGREPSPLILEDPPLVDQIEDAGGMSLPSMTDGAVNGLPRSPDPMIGSGDAPSIPVTVEEMTKSSRSEIQGDHLATYPSYDSALQNMRFDAGDCVSSTLPTAPLLTRTGSNTRPAVPLITTQTDPTSPYLPPPAVSANRLASNVCFAEPKPRLPTFNGKQDWDAFYVQFEFLASQFGWDANKKLSYLMAGLQDGALEYVSKLPANTRMNLQDLTESLKRRFGDSVLPETHRAALDLVKKEPKENLREYAARVRELMNKAYPGLDGSALFTSMLIERIVRGLPDPALVYDVLSKRPRTVEMALDAIEWHECIKVCKKKPIATRRVAEDNTYDVRQVSTTGSYVTEAKLKEICADIKESLLEALSRSEVATYSEGRGGGPRNTTGGHSALRGSRELTDRTLPVRQDSKYMRPGQDSRRQEAYSEDSGRSQKNVKRYTAPVPQVLRWSPGDRKGPSFQGNGKERQDAKYVRNNNSMPTVFGKESMEKRRENGSFQGECYVCHEYGHMARDCAEPRHLN